jgi:phenylacetate-CoA ligase
MGRFIMPRIRLSFISSFSLFFRDILLFLISKRYLTFLWGFSLLSSKYLDKASRIRALSAFAFARKKVPAYQDLILQSDPTSWRDIPCMDKDTYIKKYATPRRCVGGVIPNNYVTIDESSGSTGIPYNWVRKLAERRASHISISYFSRYCYGKGPWIIINAFSMGAWATGVNMGEALQRNGVVKNTGPDLEKIFNTLEFFGCQQRYIITGYPPFLKKLMDDAVERGFPWKSYRLCALVGGEGMSEGLRDYLLKGFESVYSGYGATDLEIGIGGETALSVAIRRLARSNQAIREDLFGKDSRLPMVFQYNPIMHYIEVNEEGELIFTINRRNLLSPRIKYNIHDQGGVMTYDHMATCLEKHGVSFRQLINSQRRETLRLPFLWVFGRKDFTISVMGANIYPEDIEQCVYADNTLARITRSYCQSLTESKEGNVRPAFYFEITEKPTAALKEQFQRSILESLIRINADFREAWKEYSDTLVPEIHLYLQGEGPFQQDQRKIKQSRLI